MTAIWHNDGTKWKLLNPSGFPDEASLHSLVEQEPQMLPLAGSPQLVIVGREVRLGAGYADLIAVEPSGRLAVMEVKLAKNAEARRAVISQVLSYASYLFGLTIEEAESQILGTHLGQRGYASLADAITKNDQEGSFDAASFRTALAQNLAEGRFRLVFVLDSAPDELVSLAGFLEAISDKLVIDLIGVASVVVAGSQIIVPQRITPETKTTQPDGSTGSVKTTGRTVQGSAEFRKAIETAPADRQPALFRLADWGDTLEASGLVKLSTYIGKGGTNWSLLPRLQIDNAGLVTVYLWDGKPSIQFWRSVFERRAPRSIPNVEAALKGVALGQGNSLTDNFSEELLQALTAAYEEANGRSPA
jgi:hypothetical protein